MGDPCCVMGSIGEICVAQPINVKTVAAIGGWTNNLIGGITFLFVVILLFANKGVETVAHSLL